MSFLDNHQEFPTDPPRTWPSRYNAMLEALDNATSGSGKVVQVVTAVSSAVDETSSQTFEATSHSVSITPHFSDSLLIVSVSGAGSVRLVSADSISRSGGIRLYNVTDAAALQGAENVRVGHNLVAASSEVAPAYFPLTLNGRYEVDSLTQRTIRLDIRTNSSATEIRAGWSGDSVLMSVMEVRP